MKTAGLYIDFPFCIARCAFCAFHIEGFRSQWAEKYLDALKKEMDHYAGQPEYSDYAIKTIYLGGGTPSLYEAETLSQLLSHCRNLFYVTPEAEITLEVHPATVNLENLSILYQGGVNRLSIGIQSFSDAYLKLLGRHHTVDQAKTAYVLARKAGFKNIALDLIFGLPEQSLRNWEETLEEALSLSPEHLSIYALSIEEGTLFGRKANEGSLCLPSEDETIQFYETARSILESRGYIQYEISNFSKKGYACRHNRLYWDREEILGFGLASHTYFKDEHRVNTHQIPTYIEMLSKNKLPVSLVEKTTPTERQMDKIIFGLRKTEGIPATWVEPDKTLRETTTQLIAQGWLKQSDRQIQLTPAGMLMADEVAMAYL